MEQYKIQFEKKESLFELESQVDKGQMILCDDIQNTFLLVIYDNVHNIGIAYYDYGIAPEYLYSQDYKYLYLGFGNKIAIIDTHKNIIVKNDNLQSVFYEFIYDSEKKYLCSICELDLYCYCKDTLKWKIGFKDIVNAYSVIEESKISIECDDGREYLFSLEDGKILE